MYACDANMPLNISFASGVRIIILDPALDSNTYNEII